MSELYALQDEALRAWRDASRCGIVEAVTGSGKTRIGVEAIREALDDGLKTVVLVPRRELQEQWYHQIISAVGATAVVGLRGSGYKHSLDDCDVLISIVNSARELSNVPRGSLLVADECHNYAATTNLAALRSAFARRLGLTATLERADGQHERLNNYFGGVCFTISYAEAFADGIISPFSIALIGLPMAPQEQLLYEELDHEVKSSYAELASEGSVDTSSVTVFMRDVKALSEYSDVSGVVARRFLNAMLERRRFLMQSYTKVAAVADLAAPIRIASRTIIFTGAIAPAEEIAHLLCQRGIPSAAVHSELSLSERSDRLGWFRDRKLEVLSAPMALDEGVDVPEADLAIIVSAGDSPRRMIQRLGRVLRLKEDRIARLAVLYLENTIEDPASGAHQGFLKEVFNVADDLAVFRSHQLREAKVFLSCLEPLSERRPPRYVGEANRSPIWDTDVSDEDDVRVALGLL